MIIPKIITKTKDISCCNLWNEIIALHEDYMIDIFKALSFYSNEKRFVLWFNFLLINHHKNCENEKEGNKMLIEIDILNEFMFYDIENIHSMIIKEITPMKHIL